MKTVICASVVVLSLCCGVTIHALGACPQNTTNNSLCIGQWNICAAQNNALACANLMQPFSADDPQLGNWSCKDNTPNDSQCIVYPWTPNDPGLKLCNRKGACIDDPNWGCTFNNAIGWQVVLANFYIVLACPN